MLNIVDKVMSILFPVMTMHHHDLRKMQVAGKTAPTHRQWHRNKQVLWFNGYPGLPKLPLVQRRRATPSSLNPVVSPTPKAGEEEVENPEPLCRKHIDQSD